MNINQFLEGLKLQFEEEDANKLIPETELSNLDTWDSLTKFSIIVFLDDEHQYKFDEKDFEKYNTPVELFNLIYK
tara:strand:+ start:198 stop:422 length:225 start_codon:yes stop_codon:yes gene_type:complete